jgi:hypothetical protein
LATAAGIKELMCRLGHVSPKAPLRYQHATRERDTTIAEAMDAMTRAARSARLRWNTLSLKPTCDRP